MATTVEVRIADDAYVQVQATIQAVSRLLIDPKVGLGEPTLDLFIERAERSLNVAPILHPSEFQKGAEKLQEVLGHAKALRAARDRIREVSGL